MGASDVLVVILAIVLPPVAVVIRRGCGADLIINILLCLLGHIPGVIHALYLILHDRERRTRSQAPYSHQTNAQAMYGASAQPRYVDSKIQQQSYPQQPQQQPYAQQPQPQPQYFDQPRAVAPEPMPPAYTDFTQPTGEKHEYGPR